MRRISGSRTCQPLSTATCGVSRKRTNSRFRGLAASWRDSSIVFGSERCSCGPAGLIRMCSNDCTACGAPSSNTSKSSAFRSWTGVPFLVG